MNAGCGLNLVGDAQRRVEAKQDHTKGAAEMAAKNADPDVPILKEAKAEYAKLP
jgi:hypothetical protein